MLVGTQWQTRPTARQHAVRPGPALLREHHHRAPELLSWRRDWPRTVESSFRRTLLYSIRDSSYKIYEAASAWLRRPQRAAAESIGVGAGLAHQHAGLCDHLAPTSGPAGPSSQRRAPPVYSCDREPLAILTIPSSEPAIVLQEFHKEIIIHDSA